MPFFITANLISTAYMSNRNFLRHADYCNFFETGRDSRMRVERKLLTKTDGVDKMMFWMYSILEVQFTFCLTSLKFASLDKNYKHPKYYILYCLIHVAFWKRQNCRKRKYIRGFQGLGESDYINARWARNEICRVWGLSVILLYGCMMVFQSKPIEL